MAQNITSKALKMIFIKRQMRLDTKWRNGYISRREYDKALNESSYQPIRMTKTIKDYKNIMEHIEPKIFNMIIGEKN